MRYTVFGLLVSVLVQAGCSGVQAGVVPAEVHQQVYQLPPEVVGALLPEDARTPLEGSDYTFGYLNLDALTQALAPYQGEVNQLHDKRRVFHGWPQVADSWTATYTGDALSLEASGACFFGVRLQEDVPHLRFEGHLTYGVDNRPSLIEKLHKGALDPHDLEAQVLDRSYRGEVLFEGPVAAGDALVLVGPSPSEKELPFVHVMVFEVSLSVEDSNTTVIS